MALERSRLATAAVVGLFTSLAGGFAAAGEAQPSRDALFGDDLPAPAAAASGWRGFIQGEAARNYRDPEHWSKGRLRVELGRQGRFSDRVKWKIEGRFDYDAAYDRSGFYPPEVRDDQRAEFMLRENYLDIAAGDWDVRVGRQHIVWGEMIGTFVADVVSAKDMREFIVQDFGQLRIPQWAGRAEYTRGDFHAELVWIPVPSFDRIGKPGADFFPHPLPVPTSYVGEEKPDRKVANSNYGFRVSQLVDGWDVAGFYYRSLDASPTFYRVSAPGAPLVLQARHDRIDQAGGTVTKDLAGFLLRAEAVYTTGRQFNVIRGTETGALVGQNTVDYAIGVDLPLEGEKRLNLQFIQRAFLSHDADIVPKRRESAASLFFSVKLAPRVEAETLVIHSLERSDWLLRPKLSWDFERNWRLMFGVDVFGGPPTGVFGRYDNNDRVYTTLRYTF